MSFYRKDSRRYSQSFYASSRPRKRLWVIPATIATVAFIGGVASNLVANYIQAKLDPYRRWVWAAGIVSLIVAIITAIREARLSGDSAQRSQSNGDRYITVSGPRGVGVGEIGDASIVTGDWNVVLHHVQAQGQAQIIGRQEIHHHYPAPLQPTSRQTEGKEAEASQPGEYQIFNLPNLHNEYFTGREDILLALEIGFKGGKSVQALNGLGGVGKTQTALEYAYRHREDYRTVLWSIANSREKLVADFVTMAGLFDLPEKDAKDQGETLKAVRRWLEKNDRWLLIIDNIDDLAMAREFIPVGGKGHVLLTTQAQGAGRIAFCHHLAAMSPREGALFLLRRIIKIDVNVMFEDAPIGLRSQAENLSKELGGLPLALDQAAAYIDEMQSTLAEYLELYRSEGTRLRARRGDLDDGYPESVFKTFSLTFEKASHDSRAAADLLRICAFLEADAIPEEIFSVSANKYPFKNSGVVLLRKLSRLRFFRIFFGRKKSLLGEALGFAVAKPGGLVEAIGRAGHFSLLRRDPKTKTLSMHRLVQNVLKDGMNEDTRRMWAERAIRVVNEAFPDVEYANWPMCDRLVQHAQALAGLIDEFTFEFSEAARLLNQAGYYLYARARYTEAEPLLKRTLAIREKWFWGLHPLATASLNNLAELYKAQGKYEQAEPFFKRALEMADKSPGQRHPYLASYLNNLAELYRAQGKNEQAEPLHTRALSLREKTSGPDHPDTAASLNNLAELYREQGKYERAEPLFKHALDIYEKALGPDHPDTAAILSNLAELYKLQGKYEQAEPLFKRALDIRKEVLGPDHPDIAANFNNLAGFYREQGKYAEAEPLFIHALEICEKTLGPDHPSTANSLNNLAALYDSQGKYKQAEPLYNRALGIREEALGPDHPDTGVSLNNLAALYYSQGEPAKAEPLLKRAHEIIGKAWGPDHPLTANSLNNLGELYRQQGKYEQAEPLFKRALDIREKFLGPDHPDTVSLNNLALLYKSRGNYEQAEPLFKRALDIREKALGADHPDTAISLHNLGDLYRAQGKYLDAEPLLRRALDINEKAPGPSHPDTAASLHTLGELYRAQGKYTEAEPLYKRALDINEEALGKEHPTVATVLENYAGLLRAIDHNDEAARLEARAKEIQEKAKMKSQN